MPDNNLKRYLQNTVVEDLAVRMVFVGGPRQVGKTTFARMIHEPDTHSTYLNWDNRDHRSRILDGEWSPDTETLILDEIHKYDQWKTLVKGIWDTRERGERVIVTGSSRLDTYRRGGDSLLGRYRYYRLHPFTLPELEHKQSNVADEPTELVFGEGEQETVDHLMAFGGFPEPCLSGNQRTHRRWLRERFERVFREDIRDTTSLRSLSQIELLGAMIPKRISSPLSLNALSEDLEVSPHTIRNWMDTLCRNYYTFQVPPYHRRIERAIKKAAKYYLWDWSEIDYEGPRFENMIASHLLKFCHYLQDVEGHNIELRYVRDREKREVDFLVMWGDTPWFLVECKLAVSKNLSHLNRFASTLGVTQKFCVTRNDRSDFVDRSTGVRVIPASKFLTALC